MPRAQVTCRKRTTAFRRNPPRAVTAVTRRVRAARFEEQASLEDFDFTVSAKLPVHAIRDLATLRFLDRAESVVLHGRVGIG